jgi:CubicO group peptidase (beta-lactamase class C family)
VVVVDADGVVFAEGYGIADDSGRQVTLQTPFRIASLSKQLTGLAVMQLVQNGELALDARISDYLPWWGAEGSPVAELTIRHLLSHTAGWGERDGSLPLTGTDGDDGAMERNARRLEQTPLQYPIGEFHYINATYDLLGYLVAEISGMTFEDYVRTEVVEPLEMSHTYFSLAEAQANGMAQGHYPFFGVPVSYDFPFSRAALPSASVIASAEDLGHVLMAHLNEGEFDGHTVLTTEAMSELHRPLVETWPGAGYGWGWYSYPLYDAGTMTTEEVPHFLAPVILEHGGSVATHASDMVLMPEAGYGIVVLMNLNDQAAPSRFYQMHLGIALILSGEQAPDLVNYDEPLRVYGRLIAIGVPLLQLAGVFVSSRRLRRWQQSPPPERHGYSWRLRHLVLPLIVDIGVPVAVWWLYFSTAQLLPVDYLRVAPFSPDLALALAAIAVLGFGWGAVRTWLTVRVIYASGMQELSA